MPLSSCDVLIFSDGTASPSDLKRQVLTRIERGFGPLYRPDQVVVLSEYPMMSAGRIDRDWVLFHFQKDGFRRKRRNSRVLTIPTDFGTALTLGNPSQSHAPKGPPVGHHNETASIEL